MAKIVSVKEDIVQIGENDGRLFEVRKSDLDFEPRLGDIVDVFKNKDTIKVLLSNNLDNNSQSNTNQSGQGININLSQTQATPAQPTYVMAGGKVVNKITYCLLCFFLGTLGVHKFYAGKIGVGLLYIICFGLFGILPLIDLIIGLTKKSDINGNIVV